MTSLHLWIHSNLLNCDKKKLTDSLIWAEFILLAPALRWQTIPTHSQWTCLYASEYTTQSLTVFIRKRRTTRLQIKSLKRRVKSHVGKTEGNISRFLWARILFAGNKEIVVNRGLYTDSFNIRCKIILSKIKCKANFSYKL